MAVRWFGEKVLKQITDAEKDVLDEVLAQVVEHARDNVRANDQIDTGHMLASFYTVTFSGSTYDLTSPPGNYFGVKSGGVVRRERAPEIQKPRGKRGIAANSAPYALSPELRNSFLFLATQQTDVPAIVKKVRRQHRLT